MFSTTQVGFVCDGPIPVTLNRTVQLAMWQRAARRADQLQLLSESCFRRPVDEVAQRVRAVLEADGESLTDPDELAAALSRGDEITFVVRAVAPHA